MDNRGRPNHIEDYLITLHTGQWFGFKNLNGNDENKIYANLIIHDDSKDKPSESDCTTGLATLQSDYDTAQTNTINNKASGKQKLKDLGLNDDEIKSLLGF
tara:strand:- start:270 stop:572 length:303 start_codon:yes stop_codon:yes gene_type:complete